MSQPLAIAFFGTPQFAVPILEALATTFTVSVVITQPAQRVGKSGIQPSPVALEARRLDLKLLEPERLTQADLGSVIPSMPVDLAVVAAYGRILPPWLLAWPRLGMINVHGSLLPAYRGASPIAAAILADDTESGISYMVMTPGMDEGPVLSRSTAPIEATETTQSLTTHLSQLAADTVCQVVTDYAEGKLATEDQDPTQVSYTGLLTKADGQIDFDQPPADLERRVRAFYPWPGVWGMFKGKRVKLLPNNQIQMEGKQATSLTDFNLGHTDFPIKSIID